MDYAVTWRDESSAEILRLVIVSEDDELLSEVVTGVASGWTVEVRGK